MADPTAYLETVSAVARDLDGLGLRPVLVGGMALVVLGSQRVTRDFDFVVEVPGDRLAATVSLFYDRGFELASRLSQTGEVTGTISSRKVAEIRLRADAPVSAYFFNPITGLRIDLLFDFPVPAAELLQRASRTKISGSAFSIAAERDLLRLKHIARKARSSPGDIEDIRFLETRLRESE